MGLDGVRVLVCGLLDWIGFWMQRLVFDTRVIYTTSILVAKNHK